MIERRISPRTARCFTALAVSVLLAFEWLATTHAVMDASSSLDSIYVNALPSIEDLGEILAGITALRRDTRRLTFERVSSATRGQVVASAESALSAIKLHAKSYEGYPTFPGEPPLQRRMDRAVEALDHATVALLDARDYEAARDIGSEQFLPATDAAYNAVNDLVRFNARQGSRTARFVYLAQSAAVVWTLWLMLTLVVLTLGLGFLIDHTGKKVERERRELMADLDAFTGRVAHDLKGVLGPIKLAVSALNRHDTPPDKARSLLQRIDMAVQNASSLIDGLLDFACAGASAASGVTTEIDPIARRIEASLTPLIESQRARFSSEIEPGLRVRASSGVVASITQNLVRNAVIHLGESEPRSVELRAQASDDGAMVSIEVSDTGPGISPSVLKRLFKPFERGTTTARGVGLGLATVKRLADGLGGSIEVESTPGLGSTFRVRLPRAKPAEQPSALRPAVA